MLNCLFGIIYPIILNDFHYLVSQILQTKWPVIHYVIVQTRNLWYKIVSLVGSSPVIAFPITLQYIISVLFLFCVTVCSYEFHTATISQLLITFFIHILERIVHIQTRSTFEKIINGHTKHIYQKSSDGYLVQQENWIIVIGYSCSKVRKCWIW